jgi:predicted CopG family antitoxin
MKTITLSDEAYARIEAAKRAPGESESEVVLRALQEKPTEPVGASPWRRLACTSEAEREELRRVAAVIEEEFERIEPEDAG